MQHKTRNLYSHDSDLFWLAHPTVECERRVAVIHQNLNNTNDLYILTFYPELPSSLRGRFGFINQPKLNISPWLDHCKNILLVNLSLVQIPVSMQESTLAPLPPSRVAYCHPDESSNFHKIKRTFIFITCNKYVKITNTKSLILLCTSATY
jgi:hypothetical protein